MSSTKKSLDADVKRLTDYAVERKVGEGMLGRVFKAKDVRSDRLVALKVLRPEAIVHAQRLQSEFRLLSTLHHPHLADVFDYGMTDEGRPYYAMEWVNGQPVERSLFVAEDGTFHAKRFAQLVRQITSALIYLRSRNIAHGDIKPENILAGLDKKGEFHAHLMDFGISRNFTSKSEGISGTFEYIAPEIIRGEAPTPAADLYSFGCVLYELVAGKQPFTGESPLEILKQHLNANPAPIPTEAGIDETIADWVETCLSKDIRLRYRIPEQLYSQACEYLNTEPETQLREEEAFSAQLLIVPRESETAKFSEIAETSKERTSFLVIEGAPGLGKSRVLTDFRVKLQLEGRQVHFLSPGSSTGPFAPIVSHLCSLPLTDDLAESASILAAFFPESFPDISPAEKSGMDADGEITRLFHAAATMIVRSNADALLIDDLHAFDDLSLEFIAYLVPFTFAQSGVSLLIALTLNPESVNRELFPPDIQNLGTTVPLQPLTKEGVATNITAIFGDALTPSFQSLVWNQSRGNLANVEDILQYCLDEGILERTRNGWIVHERDDVVQALPVTVIDKTKRRISKLGENSLQLLKTLALSDTPVDPPVLEFVLRKSIDRIHELGIILLKYDLMDLVDGKYKISSDAIRSLLDYADDERRLLHARYLEWYKQHPEYAPPTGMLAEHVLGAGQTQAAAEMFVDASKETERIYDFGLTRRYLRRALAIPGAFPDDELRFSIYQAMVRMSNILGDRDTESEYIEELLILAGRWKAKKGALRLGSVYELQTELHLALGDFDKATRSAERALNKFEEAEDELGIARCNQKLGFVLYRTKPTERVLEFYKKSQQIYAEKKELIDEANILIDIGLVHYSILNSPEEAIRCFHEAREKYDAVGFSRGTARAYGNLGVQYFELGEYEAAFQFHTQANEIFERIGDHRATAISFLHIGRSYFAIGDYLHALEDLENAQRIGKTLSDAYVVENSFESMGEVYFHLGEYDKTMECFLEAKQLALSTGFKLGEITNTQDLAEIHIERNNIETAIDSIQWAARELEHVKNSRVEAVNTYRFAQAYLAKSDVQDYTKALEYFNHLVQIADANAFDDFRILAYSYAGICHAHLGHLKEALDQSLHALQLLGNAKYVVGGKQDILLNHVRILRANKLVDDAEDGIQRAYDEVMRIAEYIDNPRFYRSFTENVAINAEVIREYSMLHRLDSPESLSISRDQNLRTLYEVSRKINSVLDLPQLLENIMDSALEAMNGERGLIFLLENEDLVLKASRNVEKETIRDATEISLSILKDVVSGGQPIIIADTMKDDETKKRESVVNYNIRSIICVPMKSRDTIIGTVYVDSRSDALSAMSFSEIDADFLVAFANLATIAIENARLHTKLQQENVYLKQEVTRQFGFENIIGASRPMEQLFRETQGATASENSVLIYGESGTGKELVARAIHYNGARKDKRFVAIDCGAFQDTLLESELFGYKRGAFTGAVADKRGLFEEAHKGTLFLDEIGNTSLAFQAKLLRVLQSGEFRRVGETETKRVDVRVIAATNTDLQKQIADGVFRQDLFYRLNVVPLRVPELRERLDDIPLLVEHFIQEFNKRYTTVVRGATKELIEALQQYSWPGNVRELENLISRILVQADQDVLSTKNLPADFDTSTTFIADKHGLQVKIPAHLKTLKEVEQGHILSVMSYTGNNKTEAAKILGLKRTTLVERMKKLGIM